MFISPVPSQKLGWEAWRPLRQPWVPNKEGIGCQTILASSPSSTTTIIIIITIIVFNFRPKKIFKNYFKIKTFKI